MPKRNLSEREFHEQRNLLPNQKVKDIADREEHRFLALILKNKEALVRAITMDHMTYKNFLVPKHSSLYSMIAKYWDDYGSMISREAFRTMTEEKHGVEKMGPLCVLFDKYMNQRVSPEDYEKLADGIRQRYSAQLFWEATGGGDIMSSILQSTDGQMKNIADLADKLNGVVAETAGNSNGYNRTDDAITVIDDLVGVLKRRRDTIIKERGLVTGIKGFDELFKGFRFGKYGVILGFPNGGKTTVMINFAHNMAREGYRVCYVTIESDSVEIMERMLSKESQIPGDVLKEGGREDGGLTDAVMNNVLHASDRLKATFKENMTFVSVSQKTPITEILAMVDRQRQFQEFDVVYFDYLDVIGHMTNNVGRPDLDLADTSQRIQKWSKENGIMAWSAQSIKNEKIKEFRKKDFMENADKASISVGVEDVGGTQAISRDADYVVAIVPHPDGDRLIVYITKSRYDAPAGSKFTVDWNRSTCTICDVSDFVMTNEKLIELMSQSGEDHLDEMYYAKDEPSEEPAPSEEDEVIEDDGEVIEGVQTVAPGLFG